jgi:hypothetical protein
VPGRWRCSEGTAFQVHGGDSSLEGMAPVSRHGRFVGGLRSDNAIASGPLAEMLVVSEGMTVRLRWRVLRAVFSSWFPTMFIPWDRLTRPELVRGIAPGSRGIRIRASDGNELTFWCYPRTAERIVDVFNSRGIKTVVDGTVMW